MECLDSPRDGLLPRPFFQPHLENAVSTLNVWDCIFDVDTCAARYFNPKKLEKKIHYSQLDAFLKRHRAQIHFMQKFQTGLDGLLQNKKSNHSTGLTRHELVELVKKAKRCRNQSNNKKKFFPVSLNSKQYFVKINPEIAVIPLNPMKRYITTDHCIIFKARDLRGKPIIIKQGIPAKKKSAYPIIRNEFNQLTSVQRSLDSPYIQKAPYGFSIAKDFVSLFSKQYKSDMHTALTFKQPDLIQVLKWCFQMAAAVKQTHIDVNRVHGDIKLENIYLDFRNNCVLADWGSAGKPTKVDSTSAFSREFCSLEEEEQINSCLNPFQPKKLAFLRKAYDIYSLGVVFYELITWGKSPYPFDENMRPNHFCKLRIEKLQAILGSESILIDLIISMLEKNPFQRVQAHEVFNCMESILSKFSFPDIQKAPSHKNFELKEYLMECPSYNHKCNRESASYQLKKIPNIAWILYPGVNPNSYELAFSFWLYKWKQVEFWEFSASQNQLIRLTDEKIFTLSGLIRLMSLRDCYPISELDLNDKPNSQKYTEKEM